MTCRRYSHRRRAVLVLALVALAVGGGSPARAAESELDHEPPPKRVDKVDDRLGKVFEPGQRIRSFFPSLKQQLASFSPFFSEAEVTLKLRSYYRNQRRLELPRAEAWAGGGSLQVRSGLFRERLGVEAELFTSQHLSGSDRRDGTGLLRSGQRSYTVVGIANARLEFGNHRLTGYRQYIDLPYVNLQDSRMTPNTFEAVTLVGERGSLAYVAGQVFKIKERNRDQFRNMSEAAGVPDSSKGMSVFGLRWKPTERFSIGAVTQFVDDVLWNNYVEVQYVRHWSDELVFRFDGQYTDQRSTGDDLLTGSSFDTHFLGLRAGLSYRSAVLRTSFTRTGSERRIASPWGSNPSYLDRMQHSFSRGGEVAWGLGYAQHFDRLGLPGLSSALSYTQGVNARLPDRTDLPDRKELDLTLDYRLQEGRLRGLWLRARGSLLDEEGNGRTGYDVRLIVNYALSVL